MFGLGTTKLSLELVEVEVEELEELVMGLFCPIKTTRSSSSSIPSLRVSCMFEKKKRKQRFPPTLFPTKKPQQKAKQFMGKINIQIYLIWVYFIFFFPKKILRKGENFLLRERRAFMVYGENQGIKIQKKGTLLFDSP